MATTLNQIETIPTSYPTTPYGLSTNAAALNPDIVWQRIEAYVAHRWTARNVVWIVEGEGDWRPPLTPATISATEIWQNDAWVAVTLDPSAYGGYTLPGSGPYRFTASVGAGSVPAAVVEAFKRLAEYVTGGRDLMNEPGATSYSREIGGDLSHSITRNAAWMARALQNSGAADLLRPYRRA